MTNRQPHAATFPAAALHSLTITSPKADKPAQARLTIRIPVSEDLEAQAALLVFLHGQGAPIELTITERTPTP